MPTKLGGRTTKLRPRSTAKSRKSTGTTKVKPASSKKKSVGLIASSDDRKQMLNAGKPVKVRARPGWNEGHDKVVKEGKRPTSKPAPSKPVANKKTEAGSYPVYKKKSESAQSFRSAFAAARKAGKKEFTWQGRRYNTKVK